MKTFAPRLFAAVGVMNRVVGWAMALCLAVMTVLITWQVFARFVVGNSLTFSEEVSRFLMIWMTMLGAAYAARQGSLLAVDLMPEMLRGRVKLVVSIAAHLVSIVFYLVLTVYGWQIAQAVAFQNAPATGVSMFWPMFALCLGGVLCAINTVAVIVEELMTGEHGTHTDHMLAEAEG